MIMWIGVISALTWIMVVAMDHRELRHAGNAAMNGRDYQRAVDLFTQSINAKPEDFNGYFFRATAHVELKDSASALKDFDKALSIKPDYLTARVKRAQLYIDMDRLEDAQNDLDFVLAKKPKHSLANIIRKRLAKSQAATQSAEILKEADDLPCPELVPKLSSVIAGLPHDSSSAEPLRMRRAECAFLSHDYSAILDDTRRVLALNSNNVRALELRGHALLALGEDEAAYQHFNKCSRRDPDNAACRWNFKRARSLFRGLKAANEAKANNDWNTVVEQVEIAAAAANDSPDDSSKKATERRFQQQSDELKRGLGSLSIGGGVHRAELLQLRCNGLAYLASREEDALVCCQHAAAANAESGEAFLLRGHVLVRLERWDEAIGDYGRAQQREPRNGRIHQARQRAEQKRKMALRKDYYKILGVARNADFKTIKRAYRKLAAAYHPDKAAEGEKEEAEKMYFELGEAYEILTDDDKKKQYDGGMDYEDIQKAAQHANSQQHNPFGFGGGGGGGNFRQHFRWG